MTRREFVNAVAALAAGGAGHVPPPPVPPAPPTPTPDPDPPRTELTYNGVVLPRLVSARWSVAADGKRGTAHFRASGVIELPGGYAEAARVRNALVAPGGRLVWRFAGKNVLDVGAGLDVVVRPAQFDMTTAETPGEGLKALVGWSAFVEWGERP